jgi:hypothetical protein
MKENQIKVALGFQFRQPANNERFMGTCLACRGQ